MRSGLTDGVTCCYCDSSELETFEHLFINCPATKRMWTYYASATSLHGPFIQLKDTIMKWWNTDCASKLKPLYKVVPTFILWQVWKRRNIIKHGGKMSVHMMGVEINRNIYYLALQKYPWLRNLPNSWPMIVMFLEAYKPWIKCKVIRWKFPMEYRFKCNSDGDFKGNQEIGAGAFCIRDITGKLMYAEVQRIYGVSSLRIEAVALRIDLEYCVEHNFLPVTLETNSLTLKKVLDGIWEVPWNLSREIRRINRLRSNQNMKIGHTPRERNQLTNFLANFVFSFAGTQVLKFNSIHEIPNEGKAIYSMDINQVATLRLIKCQNKDFTVQ